MQVKVRCGLGRVGVLGRLYGNSRGMSAPGQSPHFDRSPPTSGLPPETDILRAGRHVSKVPTLLRKSVTADGCPSAIRLLTTGFDLPVLMLVTQLQRYAIHGAIVGGGRAPSDANRRRF